MRSPPQSAPFHTLLVKRIVALISAEHENYLVGAITLTCVPGGGLRINSND